MKVAIQDINDLNNCKLDLKYYSGLMEGYASNSSFTSSEPLVIDQNIKGKDGTEYIVRNILGEYRLETTDLRSIENRESITQETIEVVEWSFGFGQFMGTEEIEAEFHKDLTTAINNINMYDKRQYPLEYVASFDAVKIHF